MENETKKVVCYYRVSGKGQVNRGTIDNQKFKCNEICKLLDYEIIAEFHNDAISGTKCGA